MKTFFHVFPIKTGDVPLLISLPEGNSWSLTQDGVLVCLVRLIQSRTLLKTTDLLKKILKIQILENLFLAYLTYNFVFSFVCILLYLLLCDHWYGIIIYYISILFGRSI